MEIQGLLEEETEAERAAVVFSGRRRPEYVPKSKGVEKEGEMEGSG